MQIATQDAMKKFHSSYPKYSKQLNVDSKVHDEFLVIDQKTSFRVRGRVNT